MSLNKLEGENTIAIGNKVFPPAEAGCLGESQKEVLCFVLLFLLPCKQAEGKARLLLSWLQFVPTDIPCSINHL